MVDLENEQQFPCDLKKLRKMLQRLDKGGFPAQGARLVVRAKATCGGRLTTSDRAALANDVALSFFHRGDDEACLKALRDPVVPVQDPAAKFNRALCAGQCTLDAAKCMVAERARKKALETRESRTPWLSVVIRESLPPKSSRLGAEAGARFCRFW
jgi:hypothetical protein